MRTVSFLVVVLFLGVSAMVPAEAEEDAALQPGSLVKGVQFCTASFLFESENGTHLLLPHSCVGDVGVPVSLVVEHDADPIPIGEVVYRADPFANFEQTVALVQLHDGVAVKPELLGWGAAPQHVQPCEAVRPYTPLMFDQSMAGAVGVPDSSPSVATFSWTDGGKVFHGAGVADSLGLDRGGPFVTLDGGAVAYHTASLPALHVTTEDEQIPLVVAPAYLHGVCLAEAVAQAEAATGLYLRLLGTGGCGDDCGSPCDKKDCRQRACENTSRPRFCRG